MITDSSYKKLFTTIEQEQVPAHIFEAVVYRIEHYKTIRARVYLTAHVALVIVAVVSLIPAIQYAMTEAANSGFMQYVSLIISDSSSIMSNWKEFSLLIAESLPIIGSIACVAALFICTNSIYRSLKYIPNITIKKYA